MVCPGPPPPALLWDKGTDPRTAEQELGHPRSHQGGTIPAVFAVRRSASLLWKCRVPSKGLGGQWQARQSPAITTGGGASGCCPDNACLVPSVQETVPQMAGPKVSRCKGPCRAMAPRTAGCGDTQCLGNGPGPLWLAEIRLELPGVSGFFEEEEAGPWSPGCRRLPGLPDEKTTHRRSFSFTGLVSPPSGRLRSSPTYALSRLRAPDTASSLE